MSPLSEQALANKKKCTAEYKKKNYKRVPLDLNHSKYDEIKDRADTLGETVNGFIKKAIDDRLEKTAE